MRPTGVWERVKELQAEQARWTREHPEGGLRRGLTWFVHDCALFAFDDVPTTSVVECFRKVLALMNDSTQHRSGSELERRAIACVEELREPLAAGTPAAVGDDEDLRAPLLRIPPLRIIGRATRDAYLPMACWNAAGSAHEGIITPYRAATLITSVGYYEPIEEADLLSTMQELRERYEDRPADRTATAVEIKNALDLWLVTTPMIT
jgi:hypothetical protein